MSVFAWVMIGVALWHLAVLVPDRFYGCIVGALIPAAVWPIPGSLVALLGTYLYGARRDRLHGIRHRLSLAGGSSPTDGWFSSLKMRVTPTVMGPRASRHS